MLPSTSPRSCLEEGTTGETVVLKSDILSISNDISPGLSPYNKIYEFQYPVNGVMSNMSMTSVSGHLLGMDFSEQFRKWYSCNPVQLFELPVEKSCREDSMIKIKQTLEREARGAKLLIIS